jgi:hypothetical protein
MKTKIIETDKIETLSIIYPKTGANLVNDLMGNYGAPPEYDGNFYIMLQENYEWGDGNSVEAYRQADNRLPAIKEVFPDEYMMRALNEVSNNYLGDLQGAVDAFCEEWEKICKRWWKTYLKNAESM